MEILKTEKLKIDSTKLEKDFGKITILGKEHDMNTFSDEQHYLVAQLNDLQSKIRRHKYEIAQFVASEKVFSQTLIDSVNNSEYKFKGIFPKTDEDKPEDETKANTKDANAA